MTPLYVALGVLGAIFLVIYLTSYFETLLLPKKTRDPLLHLKGLGLPEGSIRGLIALLVIGAFIVFVFFGKGAVSTTTDEVLRDKTGEVMMVSTVETTNRIPIKVQKTDTSLYVTVLTSLATLTSAIASFYFGSRASEPKGTASTPTEDKPGTSATPPTPPGVKPSTPAAPAAPTAPGVKPSAPSSG